MKGLQLTAATRTNDTLNMNVSLEERTIGRVIVARNKHDGTYSLQNFYVEPEERSARLTGHVMLEAIKMTQREFGVASIEMSIEMYKGYAEPRAAENDSWLKVARFVIGLKVEHRENERGFYVSTTPTTQQNRRLSTAAGLEREGFSFLSWAECDEDMRRRIEELRGEIEATKLRLPTDFPDCDSDLTVIGLYRGEVCGWMILKRLSDDEAECLRWYAVETRSRCSSTVTVIVGDGAATTDPPPQRNPTRRRSIGSRRPLARRSIGGSTGCRHAFRTALETGCLFVC